jgi:hypothetical protein
MSIISLLLELFCFFTWFLNLISFYLISPLFGLSSHPSLLIHFGLFHAPLNILKCCLPCADCIATSHGGRFRLCGEMNSDLLASRNWPNSCLVIFTVRDHLNISGLGHRTFGTFAWLFAQRSKTQIGITNMFYSPMTWWENILVGIAICYEIVSVQSTKGLGRDLKQTTVEVLVRGE